ncbi:tRNA pseudouridine synthase A [subsurface metagenome]
MRNIKIVLEYDGTNFYGWQVQPKKRTVQGVLESALEKFLCKKTKVTAAGRTDTGVHAHGQVVNFSPEGNYDEETIKNAINAHLPDDVFVKETEEVQNAFHSRFDALSRVYIYRILKNCSVFKRAFSWYYGYDLDISRMNEGCQLLLGQKDFTSFTVTKSKKENMCMDINRCQFRETEDEIIFEIEADRFLHKCVRIIIGTFVLLGRKKLEVVDIQKILLAKDRRRAGSTAPPNGLFLKEVKY